jgi:hypothetical protein
MNFETLSASLNKTKSAEGLPDMSEIPENELESNDFKEKTEVKGKSFKQADQVEQARKTLETVDGKATTPENERKVREARKALGEVAKDLPDEAKNAVKSGQEKDGILNNQVADGRLNLNDVENRMAEFENHQRAELHHAIENRLSAKLIPALAAYDVNSLSDLQIAMNCDSQSDLITTCENILRAVSPHTERNFETSDMHESIGNLDELESILIAGFRLQKEDADFKLEQFRIDPEAALGMIMVEREIEGMSDEEKRSVA